MKILGNNRLFPLDNNYSNIPAGSMSVPIADNKPKKTILCWSDSVLATTGFGVVSHHILKALYSTGKYEIDQLAINYFGDFYDKNKIPYCLVPARLGDPRDPYGNQMFVDAIKKKDYDFILVINDSFVVHQVSEHMIPLRKAKMDLGRKPFKLVYYYPVDCHLLPGGKGMVEMADRAVAYTNFTKEETIKTFKGKEGIPSDVIYHGTDIENFFPLPKKERELHRREMFKIADDNTFLIVNVNRNSLRKNIAQTLLVYKEFKKKVPNSLLYLHTVPKDGGAAGGHVVDLMVPVGELGFELNKDVVFPARYSAAKGYPVQVLNRLYGCGDCFLTTHLGEGWGLVVGNAMAAGVPIVAPNNTSMPELLGCNNERGYLYPCKEMAYADNSGYRPLGRMEDILDKLFECYEDWKERKSGIENKQSSIIREARAFTQKYSWNNVCKQWVELFNELENDTCSWEKEIDENNVQITGEKL